MSILSSTKTGKTAFLTPETRSELEQMIIKEIYEKGWKCDLNHIKTHKITDMSCLFMCSFFNGDISEWDVSNVKNMKHMFDNSKFNQDISNWKIKPDCSTSDIFYKCPIKDEYKPIILLKQETARRKFAHYIITRI